MNRFLKGCFFIVLFLGFVQLSDHCSDGELRHGGDYEENKNG